MIQFLLHYWATSKWTVDSGQWTVKNIVRCPCPSGRRALSVVRFAIAIFFIVTIWPPSTTLAADKPLFDLMREISRMEVIQDADGQASTEDIIKGFVTTALHPDVGPIGLDDIEKAFETGKRSELCKEQNGRKKISYDTPCDAFALKIQVAVRREEEIRTLGRDLQAIAAGYEMPIDGYPGRVTNMPLRYQSIVALWQAGTGSLREGVGTGILLRVMAIPEDPKIEAEFSTLGNYLKDIKSTGDSGQDQFTAAVWRYQHGVRFVGKQRTAEFPPPLEADPQSGPGTERYYLFKRWNALEHKLLDIYTDSTAGVGTLKPPLRRREVVFFLPPKKYLEQLPDNVLLWTYRERMSDGTATGSYLSGDVGLQWNFPVEPVQPSLILDPDTSFSCRSNDFKDNPDCPAITGGGYPPPPRDGVGLCTFPFARLGYLCRGIQPPEGESCPKKNPVDGKIQLAQCESGKEEVTQSGPDVCRNINYKVPGGVPQGENPDYVCTPGRETKYGNSIGNSFCFIGQCAEQSVETHRLIGGRSPLIAQDQAYPWDSCMPPDPQFNAFATPPPLTASWFPAYRPALLIKRLDTALCQTNGLPPRSETFLCGFDVRRRLELPLKNLAENPLNILDQGAEYNVPALGFQSIVRGLGARIGTTLYTGYLYDAARAFGEVMATATETMGKLAAIHFTPKMCPRNAAEANGMTTHYDICVTH